MPVMPVMPVLATVMPVLAVLHRVRPLMVRSGLSHRRACEQKACDDYRESDPMHVGRPAQVRSCTERFPSRWAPFWPQDDLFGSGRPRQSPKPRFEPAMSGDLEGRRSCGSAETVEA
jgi:hypothetical protein